MHEHYILGVHVTNRTVNSVEVQKVFSEYGCYIKTRVGLHDVDETGGMCSSTGIVVLEIIGGRAIVDQIIAKLKPIAGIQTELMVFSHPQ
ncbi:MAG TPA: hypothetical protein PLB35_09165 [Myxococcota bacterium]|nr:hypothetical protein [Myxococcota bacterium]HOA12761.1 hypothetical protein [Myxococcota bacterium]HOH77413.1 hypothetical protein [Myxococcota bacterium]HPV04906.1 hypothetical protein [Myxococcota bacterium]